MTEELEPAAYCGRFIVYAPEEADQEILMDALSYAKNRKDLKEKGHYDKLKDIKPLYSGRDIIQLIEDRIMELHRLYEEESMPENEFHARLRALTKLKEQIPSQEVED